MMSNSTMNMRALVRWSDISLTATVPTPWNGEPSRRMAYLLLCGPALEKARVDRIEARLIHREPPQRAIRRNHGARRVGPHIALGGQAEAIRRDRLDPGDAADRGQPPVEPGAIGLHLDHEACTQHLPGEVGHRADEHDAPGLE